MKKRNRFNKRIKKLRKEYECGGCNTYFDTAYLLHDHMREHVEGGSYFYNNTIQTAFPVSAKTDVATQTCQSDVDETNTDGFAGLTQNIKNEEISDSDNYDGYDNLSNELNNELDETDREDANEKPESKDMAPEPVTTRQRPGSKRLLVNSSKTCLDKANKQKKSARLLKNSGDETNHYRNISETDFKQRMLHLQELRISLTRIDDSIKTENTIKRTAKEDTTKGFSSTDKYQSVTSTKRTETSEKKFRRIRNRLISTRPNESEGKTYLRRRKRKAAYKADGDSDENVHKIDIDDPDYIPAGTENTERTNTEPDFVYMDESTDSADDDTGDLIWKRAKLECKYMKCEHCHKFIEDEFTKENLLALHKIPFWEENGRIWIQTNKKLHQTNKLCIKAKRKIYPRKKEILKCEECGKAIMKEYLRQHMVRCHNATRKSKGRPKKDKYFTCEICNKVLRTHSRREHERRHMAAAMKPEPDEALAVCEICGKTCANEKSLVSHKRIHSIQNLSCKHCDHVASSIPERERHRKTHRQYYHCETCGIDIVTKKGYQKHIMNLHQKVKRYICDVCGNQFFAKHNMERHRATHFAPSLECSYCGRKFADPVALKRHVMTHTGDFRYICGICNHGFIQSTPYRMHMQKKHSISRDEAFALNRMNFADESDPSMKLENS